MTPTLEQKLKEEAQGRYPGWKVVFALPMESYPVCMFGAETEADLIEAHKAVVPHSIDIPANVAHHRYLDGTKSPTMLTHVIKRSVELAREFEYHQQLNPEDHPKFRYLSLDQITAKILEEVK